MIGKEDVRRVRRRLYEILEERHSDDLVSILVDTFIVVLIFTNVFAFVAETVEHINNRYAAEFGLFNIV